MTEIAAHRYVSPTGRITRGLGRWLFRFALLAALLVAIAGFILNFGLPRYWENKGLQIVHITGGSMEPTIHVGEEILINVGTPSTALKPDTIVTFRSGNDGHLTTHRIVSQQTVDAAPGQVYYKTKGDANKTADPNLVPATAIVGVFDREIGPLGNIMIKSQTSKGRFLMFGPALLLFGLAEVPGLFRRDRTRPEETPEQDKVTVTAG